MEAVGLKVSTLAGTGPAQLDSRVRIDRSLGEMVCGLFLWPVEKCWGPRRSKNSRLFGNLILPCRVAAGCTPSMPLSQLEAVEAFQSDCIQMK